MGIPKMCIDDGGVGGGKISKMSSPWPEIVVTADANRGADSCVAPKSSKSASVLARICTTRSGGRRRHAANFGDHGVRQGSCQAPGQIDHLLTAAIKYSGDITKAFALWALTTVMIGNLLGRCADESPGETILYQGRTLQRFTAVWARWVRWQKGSKDRYFAG